MAQVFPVDRAIRVEGFGKLQGDAFAGRAAGAQPGPTGDILPEIIDIHAGFRLGDGPRLGPANGADDRRLEAKVGNDSSQPALINVRNPKFLTNLGNFLFNLLFSTQ